jgi:ElaB/YqjD/DUF883 family membrane-anchored ribosome-binding protein
VTGPAPEKSSTEIQNEMIQTREAISEKVAALEHQVLGTIRTAADTVTNTVDVVKDAVASAPAAVGETMRQTVEAVKETVASFSLEGCVRSHPWSAMGSALLAGFLVSRRTSATPAAPLPIAPSPVASAPQEPGLLAEVRDIAGRELKQLAEHAIQSLAHSAKQALESRLPQVADAAVRHWAEVPPARVAAPRLRRDTISANGI